MKIRKFEKFLNEEFNLSFGNEYPIIKELPMFYSKKFKELLNGIDSKISKKLLDIPNNGVKYQISYVDVTDDIETVSVLPVNRVPRLEKIDEKDYENPSDNSVVWGEKFRQPMRIGALVTRLLPEFNGTKELENFVYALKGKLDAENYEIRLVRGEEIRKWYLVTNYYNPNPEIPDERPDEGEADLRTPLMKSCLRQPEKQDFFDIYCKNPNQVGMLLLLNRNKKLVARAIIWFGVHVVTNPNNPPKGIFMDRVYYTSESDVNIFIDHCKANGWWYKTDQNRGTMSWVINGEKTDRHMTIVLENHGVFEKYPYMDTMYYYTPLSGRLSSVRGKPFQYNGEWVERFELHSARGGAKRLLKEK